MIADTHSLNQPAATVSAAVRSRHSIRAFTSQAVDPQLLREVIAKAARAPSGGNVQPWKIIVLGGPELERMKTAVAERIAANPEFDPPEYQIYPPNLKEPHKTQRFRVGEAMYGLLGIPREDKEGRLRQFQENYRFFGAPVGLFCYVDRQMDRAQWSDLGMYLQTLMLLLREQGLSSCPQECWSTYHTLVRELLQPPEEWMLFCGMAIGYANPEAAINRLDSERLPLDQFAEFRGL